MEEQKAITRENNPIKPKEPLLLKIVVGLVKIVVLTILGIGICIAVVIKLLVELAILCFMLSLLFSCPPAFLILLAIAACRKE